MSSTSESAIKRIRNQYLTPEVTRFDQLRELDNRVKYPALIFAYIFGAISSLVLGFGMCLAMEVIGSNMILGIVIGLFGMLLCSITYPIYKKILNSRKEKYRERIIELSDSMLSE